MLTLNLILIALLLHISYQDFKSRTIYWIGIPIILIIYAFLVGFYKVYIPDVYEIVLNIGIISLQLVFVWIYFKISTPDEKGFIDTKLGLGDVLLLYSLVFIFAPVALIIFELVVCVFSLFISLITYQLRKLSKPLTIPFAGNLSLVTAIVFMLELYSGHTWRNLNIIECMQTLSN